MRDILDEVFIATSKALNKIVGDKNAYILSTPYTSTRTLVGDCSRPLIEHMYGVHTVFMDCDHLTNHKPQPQVRAFDPECEWAAMIRDTSSSVIPPFSNFQY